MTAKSLAVAVVALCELASISGAYSQQIKRRIDVVTPFRHRGSILNLDELSLDGMSLVISVGADGKVKMWLLNDPKNFVGTYYLPFSPKVAAFSRKPDSRYLAYGRGKNINSDKVQLELIDLTLRKEVVEPVRILSDNSNLGAMTDLAAVNFANINGRQVLLFCTINDNSKSESTIWYVEVEDLAKLKADIIPKMLNLPLERPEQHLRMMVKCFAVSDSSSRICYAAHDTSQDMCRLMVGELTWNVDRLVAKWHHPLINKDASEVHCMEWHESKLAIGYTSNKDRTFGVSVYPDIIGDKNSFAAYADGNAGVVPSAVRWYPEGDKILVSTTGMTAGKCYRPVVLSYDGKENVLKCLDNDNTLRKYLIETQSSVTVRSCAIFKDSKLCFGDFSSGQIYIASPTDVKLLGNVTDFISSRFDRIRFDFSKNLVIDARYDPKGETRIISNMTVQEATGDEVILYRHSNDPKPEDPDHIRRRIMSRFALSVIDRETGSIQGTLRCDFGNYGFAIYDAVTNKKHWFDARFTILDAVYFKGRKADYFACLINNGDVHILEAKKYDRRENIIPYLVHVCTIMRDNRGDLSMLKNSFFNGDIETGIRIVQRRDKIEQVYYSQDDQGANFPRFELRTNTRIDYPPGPVSLKIHVYEPGELSVKVGNYPDKVMSVDQGDHDIRADIVSGKNSVTIKHTTKDNIVSQISFYINSTKRGPIRLLFVTQNDDYGPKVEGRSYDASDLEKLIKMAFRRDVIVYNCFEKNKLEKSCIDIAKVINPETDDFILFVHAHADQKGNIHLNKCNLNGSAINSDHGLKVDYLMDKLAAVSERYTGDRTRIHIILNCCYAHKFGSVLYSHGYSTFSSCEKDDIILGDSLPKAIKHIIDNKEYQNLMTNSDLFSMLSKKLSELGSSNIPRPNAEFNRILISSNIIAGL